MKSHTHECGGSNRMFAWAYISSYATRERIIWVFGADTFTRTGRAVIDDFGNLVEVA